ncbi:MAG: sterol desaturase family protein [Pseudomonadota bacterium]
MTALPAWEPLVRVGAFIGVLLIMLAWERRAPRRTDIPRRGRWFVNAALVLVDTAIVRLLGPLLPVAVAVVAADRGWGLFHAVAWPLAVTIPLTIVLMDLAIYWQHRLFHRIPLFWRLHRVHHSDTGFDATTGVRFHPAEIVVSLLWKLIVVTALGAPVIGVVVFEIVLSATSLFNHGNVRMPGGVDAALRRVIVTPDMHRVHHSSTVAETDSNFGFNLSLWDRLFGSYRAQPAAGHRDMQIGLKAFRTSADQRLPALLTQPVVPITVPTHHDGA